MTEPFGRMPDGETVHRVNLKNGPLSATILTYGARLQSLYLDDHPFSLVLGYPTLAAYLEDEYYLGAIVGRVANRIAEGRLQWGGAFYELDRNENGCQTLHGGSNGTANRNWQIKEENTSSVTLAVTDYGSITGFPGDCEITCTYALEADGILALTLTAVSSADTVCNLAPHSYFNLSGETDILNHELEIFSDHYLPVDEKLIPTGELAPTVNSLFDFDKSRVISPAIAHALDHNFCLRHLPGHVSPACRLSAENGLELTVSTSLPGLQLFAGSGMKSRHCGINGTAYGPFAGLAIEPQYWPDAPSHRHFPSIGLAVGETFQATSLFSFKPSSKR